MHRLIKIRVVRDLERLQERVRGFMQTVFESACPEASFWPAADFYETTRGLVLRMDLAGVAAEDLSITLAGQELVIRGRRRPPPSEGLCRFIHLEIGFGCFERSFMLPIPVDFNNIQARQADGILEVLLPRKTPGARSIPVKSVP
jgi:HSP20 family protein